jgi:transposase-like protein
MDVLPLTYDIVPAFLLTLSSKGISSFLQQLLIGPNSVEMSCWNVLSSSQKIGGPNKTAEIDESKFGRRKYNRGHKVNGHWVFSGVEPESGKTFLFPVPERTSDTLMAVLLDWIEPDTTVINDCWSAYRDIETHCYTHKTVDNTVGFVDVPSGAHTNIIASTWRHVKAFLNPYNRMGENIYNLAHYMFLAGCHNQKAEHFTSFVY